MHGTISSKLAAHLLDEAPAQHVVCPGHARDERNFLQGLGISVGGSLIVLQQTQRDLSGTARGLVAGDLSPSSTRICIPDFLA